LILAALRERAIKQSAHDLRGLSFLVPRYGFDRRSNAAI
jgi:hypothetical protein